MKQDEQPYTERSNDEPLEQSLDRLGAWLAPNGQKSTGFVARVMEQIAAEPLHQPATARRFVPARRWPVQWIIRCAAALAACALLTLVVRQLAPARHAPPAVANVRQTAARQPVRSASPQVADESTPTVRRSTWSTVTEDVVLEHDVPVRKLLYREFERVELLNAQGKTESRLIVPTKVMLVATNELY